MNKIIIFTLFLLISGTSYANCSLSDLAIPGNIQADHAAGTLFGEQDCTKPYTWYHKLEERHEKNKSKLSPFNTIVESADSLKIASDQSRLFVPDASLSHDHRQLLSKTANHLTIEIERARADVVNLIRKYTGLNLTEVFESNPDLAADILKGQLSIQRWTRSSSQIDGSNLWNTLITDTFTSAGCRTNANEECSRFFESFKPLLLAYNATSEFGVDRFKEIKRKNDVKRFSDLHTQWESYIYDTGFMWPHELIVNNLFHGGFNELARFKEAPTDRLIFLHPEATFAWSDTQNDGESPRVGLVLEWIGYMRWSGYSKNKVKNPIGVSIVSTHVNVDGQEDTGTGAMFHYKDFALSVTKHGDDTVYMLNVNLLGWANEKFKLIETKKEKFEEIIGEDGFDIKRAF